jgi:alanine racemase
MGPTRAYINHQHLLHNYDLIKNAVAPAKVMCVVKADAYGHGSIEISRTLINHGAQYLGVAFAEEGIELRKAGIQTPVLVFGAQLSEFMEDHLRYDLDLTITGRHQIEPLRQLCLKYNKKARIHIKFDTGMNRVGFPMNNARMIIDQLFEESLFTIVGIYSHLSSSDEGELTFTHQQLQRFNEIRNYILAKYSQPLLFHIANSGAIMRLPESYFDMVRPGVMLYGNPPGPDFDLQWDLKEVMTFASKVALIKRVAAGEPVSYSRRYYTKKETDIAVIPVGYADGYNRLLTNRGQVLIGGKRYPVVGSVCMDQILVDLGPDSGVEINDEVVLFGEQEKAGIPNIEICRYLNTIPYEVTCWVSRRIPRIHIMS